MFNIICYSLIPVQLLAYVLSGYLIGKAIDDSDNEIIGGCVILGLIIGVLTSLISIACGIAGEKSPPNMDAVLGLDLGAILVGVLSVICYIVYINIQSITRFYTFSSYSVVHFADDYTTVKETPEEIMILIERG